MHEPIRVLDPTYDETVTALSPAARLGGLAGATVGIISNGKHGTLPFFDAFADELVHRYGVADVVRVVKPNYSAPAGDEIIDRAREWNALVSGIGD